MEYSKEFKALLESTDQGYIGHGNPNAKILFIGQEPAIDPYVRQDRWGEEIVHNASQWKKLVAESVGYDAIDHTKNEFGLPLHPWANQKFQVRSEMQDGSVRAHEGSARTWYNYQKLINRIFELYSSARTKLGRNDFLDFHRLSFHTDMCDQPSLNHKISTLTTNSVLKRFHFLSNDYFRKFPIVIAAVGHFPRDTYGDAYFGDVFEVEYIGNEETEPNAWMNVSIRKSDEKPMLLIHTPQFADSISDRYVDQMARRVVNFAREHKINLLPD